MTAQINDTCFHRKINFSIAGISGHGLFDPTSIGIQPVMLSTACWRGYVAHYSILDGRLFLTSLDLGLPGEDRPKLFGVSPTPARFAGYSYQGFQHPVAFTGGLLLAEGFIRELYVHMGFHPAWKYEHVQEVIFKSGLLVEDHNRSADMAEIRAKFDVSGGDKTDRHDSVRWIEKCFSRDY